MEVFRLLSILLAGECVNNIIKFYYGKPKENTSIATLLCGEQGLVYHFERTLLFGFRSSRLFGRNLYIWDFISTYCIFGMIHNHGAVLMLCCTVRVKEEEETVIDRDDELEYFCKLVTEVQNANNSLGKEGRFQVFICVAIRWVVFYESGLPSTYVLRNYVMN